MAGRRQGRIAAVDLFCGAGGLSAGLKAAGVNVVVGLDNDAACRYPFVTNIGSDFMEVDIREVGAQDFDASWPANAYKLLAGCAPCQPFSPYRRGQDTSGDAKWPLLKEFTRLTSEIMPDFVTMENVPRIGRTDIFRQFLADLQSLGYAVKWQSCSLLHFGVPQSRRRMVLMASRLGQIDVPAGGVGPGRFATVRSAIEALPAIESGGIDPGDALHKARKLSPLNMKRIQASVPGGDWRDWPTTLRAPCHEKASGASFRNVYARMAWDKPSPTITTLSNNFGAGRFGHPQQDRPISLREAAILQGFPRSYKFVAEGETPQFSTHGRLIGNAVPPPLGLAIGKAFLAHLDYVTGTAL